MPREAAVTPQWGQSWPQLCPGSSLTPSGQRSVAEGNEATEQNTFIIWIKMGGKRYHFALQKNLGELLFTVPFFECLFMSVRATLILGLSLSGLWCSFGDDSLLNNSDRSLLPSCPGARVWRVPSTSRAVRRVPGLMVGPSGEG